MTKEQKTPFVDEAVLKAELAKRGYVGEHLKRTLESQTRLQNAVRSHPSIARLTNASFEVHNSIKEILGVKNSMNDEQMRAVDITLKTIVCSVLLAHTAEGAERLLNETVTMLDEVRDRAGLG